MIEYTFEEAVQVLHELEGSLQASINNITEELEFIKEQLTVTQVSMYSGLFVLISLAVPFRYI